MIAEARRSVEGSVWRRTNVLQFLGTPTWQNPRCPAAPRRACATICLKRQSRSVAEIVLATMKRRTSASNVTSKASRCRGHRQPPLNDDMTSVALHCIAPSKITMGMLATGSNPHGPALPPWTFPPKACARTELGKKCGCARAESRARI